MLATTALASLVAIFMAVNFHLADGAPHPWLIPKDGFDEGIALDSLLPAIQLVLIGVSPGLLRTLRRNHTKRRRRGLPSPGKEPDMTASSVFFLLLVLACPLMMWLMMRGGHGHGGHGGCADHREQPASTDDLRRKREDLDRLIEERELSEREQADPKLTPHGWKR